jgi:hypothetical protein
MAEKADPFIKKRLQALAERDTRTMASGLSPR